MRGSSFRRTMSRTRPAPPQQIFPDVETAGLDFSWHQIEGPDLIFDVDASGVFLNFTATATGSVTIELQVCDDREHCATDQCSFEVGEEFDLVEDVDVAEPDDFDADGFGECEEVTEGTDPLDANSHP